MDFRDTLAEIFQNILAVVIILAVVTAPFWVIYVAYKLNKADVVVYVDDKEVYNGPDHFVTVNFSKYNTTKEVKIYRDVFTFVLDKRYISDDVRMESK